MSEKINNPEFQTHSLNEEGVRCVARVRSLYDKLLTELTEGCDKLVPQWSRELPLVKQKLEEACMLSVKAAASHVDRQTEE